MRNERLPGFLTLGAGALLLWPAYLSQSDASFAVAHQIDASLLTMFALQFGGVALIALIAGAWAVTAQSSEAIGACLAISPVVVLVAFLARPAHFGEAMPAAAMGIAATLVSFVATGIRRRAS